VFAGATCLKKVTLGTSIAIIGYNAFCACYNIDTIFSLAANPPTLYSETGAFGHVTLPRNIPIIVPCGSVPAYMDSDWSSYSSDIQEDPDCQSTDVKDDNMTELTIFPNPTNGIINIMSPETISEIEVINSIGQVVYRMKVNADNAVCDLEELNAGIYFVKVYGIDATSLICQRKIVKE
jgi:hypothetical protein